MFTASSGSRVFGQVLLPGVLVLGLLASVAAADLTPSGPVSKKQSCATGAGNFCSGGTCSGNRFQMACCCRPNATALWSCSCVDPGDCEGDGTRQCQAGSF
jgi:hypothetical protein